MIPVIIGEIPNALFVESAMLKAWTPEPVKPVAKIVAMANSIANGLFFSPFSM